MSTATAMAMLNVRMERDLRDQGNAVLAEMNITPSQLARALWEKLAGDRHQAEAQVEAIMAPSRTPERQAEISRKIAALHRIDDSWNRFTQAVRLDPSTYVPMTDEEVEEARYEHLLEKFGE